MHILAISHHYPPEVNAPATRMSEHAREWVRAGHKVTIVTGAPNHPAGKVYPGYRNRLFGREMVEGVEVIRVWTWLAANRGFARRTLNHLSFLVSVVLQGWRLPRYDLVISTSPQFFCGLAGWFFKRRNRPWVLEIRDLWPESIIAVGAMRKGWLITAIEGLERFAYRQADLVVSVTDGFVPHIAKRRGDKPVVVVKNGVDLTLFGDRDVEAANHFRSQHGLSGKFVAAYIGTHGMAHGLDTILEAAGYLAHRDDIRLLLVGDGAQRGALIAERDRRGLTNVIMLDQQPRALMPAIWGATDAALILLRQIDTFKSVLPSKMFEAMAIGCPIIMAVEGEAKALMQAGDAGIATTPEAADELAAAILALADNPARAARLGKNGQAFVRREFDRTRLAAAMMAAFTKLAAR